MEGKKCYYNTKFPKNSGNPKEIWKTITKRRPQKDPTIELLLIEHIPSTIIRRLQIFFIVTFSTSTGTEQLLIKQF